MVCMASDPTREQDNSISVMDLMRKVPTEAAAYEYMEHLRWGDTTPECPHCGNTERAYYLRPANGVSRKTRTGTVSERRVWKCGACRKQFSVLTGTIFHGTKIPVRMWLMVIFEMCASKNGVAAREIERKYQVDTKTAWHMLHRIREAMKREPLAGLLGGNGGTVVADETFIGGKPKNKHRQGRDPFPAGPSARADGPVKRTGGTPHHKTAVLSLVDKTTGEVRSTIVPNVTGESLADVITEQVDLVDSHLHTDAAKAYRPLGRQFASHAWVDHGAYEYVRGDVSTNQAEGYFSQLKRSLDGTHHHVSVEHLPRYLSEFDFRYSTRDETDTERMKRLVGQVDGRRLTYRPLTER